MLGAITRKIMSGSMPRRWGVLSGIDIGADGDPYLDRLRLAETPWFAVFLHHIHRPDKDPDPHDHPWAFASLVLAGSYIERVWPDKRNPHLRRLRVRERFTFGTMSRDAAHIIKSIDGPLWTLVVTGPSHGGESWGFWVRGKGVQWRVYISANGGEEYAAAKDRENGPQHRDVLS
jgi:hypothetical protein